MKWDSTHMSWDWTQKNIENSENCNYELLFYLFWVFWVFPVFQRLVQSQPYLGWISYFMRGVRWWTTNVMCSLLKKRQTWNINEELNITLLLARMVALTMVYIDESLCNYINYVYIRQKRASVRQFFFFQTNKAFPVWYRSCLFW